MLTKLKKLFVLVMFAAFVFVLAGCKSDVEVALEGLLLPTEVSEDFTLPSASLEGAVTTWTSSDESIIKVDGTYAEVYRPSGADKTVKLTANVTLGEETGNKEFEVKVICFAAPDSIKIKAGKLKYDEAKGAYLMVKGAKAQLEIIVADEEMSTEVKWGVSSSKRASISETGELTALEYGEVKVSATSTSATVKDEIKIIIVESTNPQEVLLNNKKAIEEQLPQFVCDDYVFPMAPNDSVETFYFDALADRTDEANALYYGEYAYIYDETSVDRQETLYCVLKYEGVEIEFEFTICVVADEEDNEFKALEYAKGQLDQVFASYVGKDASKVAGNIEVPEEFSAEEALYDVTLSYDVVCSFPQVPLSMKKVGEAGAEKLNAVYSKPNDDTTVRIEVYCKTANNDAIYRYNMVAAGYTKAEIVEYIQANVLPQANEAGEYKLVCQNITLPSSDTSKKFDKLSIEWKSSDTAVLTDEGRFANPALAAQTSVTLTATIKYNGTNDGSFAFEDSVSIEFDVYPAENLAQSVALQVGNYINEDVFLSKIKYYPFGKSDRLDADGNITNVMPLPKKVSELTSELAEYADLEIKWAASEEGLLDENYKLLKQYLRYHEAVLTYTVTVDGIEASGEVVINVGITEVKNTIYLGGNWYQQSGTGEVSGDVLCQLSKFDSPVGVLGGAAKTWGYSYNQGQFQGTTWYIDVYVTDENGEPTEEFTRYQYFAHVAGFHTLDDMYKIELADPADPTSAVITLNQDLNSLVGTNYGGNWAAIYHNVTDHEVKIPLAPLAANAFLGSAEVQWGNHPWNKSNVISRDNAFSIDGWRIGFVFDAEGKVVIGSGADSQFQVSYDPDGDGQLTEADYWVTIPAGGYAYTPRTQQNAGDATGTYMRHFCQVGAEIKVSFFDPYFSSPDGSSEGLGSWKHE